MKELILTKPTIYLLYNQHLITKQVYFLIILFPNCLKDKFMVYSSVCIFKTLLHIIMSSNAQKQEKKCWLHMKYNFI